MKCISHLQTYVFMHACKVIPNCFYQYGPRFKFALLASLSHKLFYLFVSSLCRSVWLTAIPEVTPLPLFYICKYEWK